MTITINDVAKHAGVSKATVSRVLNNYDYVAEDVRQRVMQSVDALGYQPNRSARRLRVQSSDLIGLIIPDIENPLFQKLVRAVEDTAYEQGMNVVLCNTDDNPDKQKAYFRIMQAERAAGLIVVPTHPKDGKVLEAVRAGGTPIVLLDREVKKFDADTVKVDNTRGAYLAMQHLIQLGYARIGIIAGTQTLTPGHERLKGCYDAAQDAGFVIDERFVRIGNFKIESGHALAQELMQMPDGPPEAIFVSNNLMTMGALRGLHELGVRIPEEVALVGFDEMPWAGDLNPALTTIAQPDYELGKQAVQLLLNRIERPDAPFYKVMFQPQLIIRQSCGAHLRGK